MYCDGWEERLIDIDVMGSGYAAASSATVGEAAEARRT
jgi:hypothetical protein